MSHQSLLEITDLTVAVIKKDGASTTLIDGIGFSLERGEIVGVVGESGCGKSITMLALLGLLPDGVEMTNGSRIRIGEVEVTAADPRALERLRGRVVSLIPADAGAALDPVARNGAQLERAIRAHQPKTPRRQLRAAIRELFERVRLPDPDLQMKRYPHQLSGGMQQRVAITSALLNDPQLVIADEATTALDVTVQAQVLKLLLDIRDRTGAGVLFVTHDMTAVAEICDRVIVMYAGRIVESGPVAEVVANPAHPYTRSLLAAVPPLHGPRPSELPTIPGTPPLPGAWPSGCPFRPRCPRYSDLGHPEACSTTVPSLPSTGGAACHFTEAR